MQEFFDAIRPLFGGQFRQEQVDGLNDLLAVSSHLSVPHRAYFLASVYHETGARMQPVRETFAETDQQAVDRLEQAWRRGHLHWVKTPYWRRDDEGKAWYGRGHIQITWRENYRKLGDRLGVDLVENPDRALNPTLSASIALVGMEEGLFTGRKLSDYADNDYVSMRAIVNGKDRANLIAGYARAFEDALRAIPAPRPEPIDATWEAPEPDPDPAPSFWEMLVDLWRVLFGGQK